MPRDGAIIVGDLAGKVDVRTRNRDTQKSPAGALPCPTRYGAPRGGRSRAGEALLARQGCLAYLPTCQSAPFSA
jgi:hypothetical protein